MSNTIWAVDGSFFAQRLSGIQRYSIELLAALDRIVPPGFVEIVTPPGVETPHYTNIKVVSFGTHRGGVWQQLDYPRYLRQRGAGGLAPWTPFFMARSFPLAGFGVVGRSVPVDGLLRCPCTCPDLETFFRKNAFQHIFSRKCVPNRS